MSFDATRRILDHHDLSFLLSIILQRFETRQIVLLDVTDLRSAKESMMRSKIRRK